MVLFLNLQTELQLAYVFLDSIINSSNNIQVHLHSNHAYQKIPMQMIGLLHSIHLVNYEKNNFHIVPMLNYKRCLSTFVYTMLTNSF